jgi:hypothetical protein
VKSRAASGARIIVLGYPRVLSGSSCLGTLGISSTEQSKANAPADDLDKVIAKHAGDDQVTYVSAISAFLGHAVCSFSPYLNGLNLFNTGESYHPTRSGQSPATCRSSRGRPRASGSSPRRSLPAASSLIHVSRAPARASFRARANERGSSS